MLYGVTGKSDQQFRIRPIDAFEDRRRDYHPLAADPVARVDDQIVDPPARFVDQEIVDVSDLAVAGLNVIAGDLFRAAQIGRRAAPAIGFPVQRMPEMPEDPFLVPPKEDPLGLISGLFRTCSRVSVTLNPASPNQA